MSEEPDYKEKYLEERFNGIARLVNGQFINVNEKLEAIHEQTTKTNSRVTHLEEKVQDLEIADRDHIINCEVSKKLEAVRDDMIIDRAIKKHPKIAMTILAIVILFFVLGIIGMFDKDTNIVKKLINLNTEQVEKPSK